MTNHTAIMTTADNDGDVIIEGETLIDFRGTHWGFIAVTRGPQPGRSAKVKVSDGLGGTREFYASVFPGLEVI